MQADPLGLCLPFESLTVDCESNFNRLCYRFKGSFRCFVVIIISNAMLIESFQDTDSGSDFLDAGRDWFAGADFQHAFCSKHHASGNAKSVFGQRARR